MCDFERVLPRRGGRGGLSVSSSLVSRRERRDREGLRTLGNLGGRPRGLTLLSSRSPQNVTETNFAVTKSKNLPPAPKLVQRPASVITQTPQKRSYSSQPVPNPKQAIYQELKKAPFPEKLLPQEPNPNLQPQISRRQPLNPRDLPSRSPTISKKASNHPIPQPRIRIETSIPTKVIKTTRYNNCDSYNTLNNPYRPKHNLPSPSPKHDTSTQTQTQTSTCTRASSIPTSIIQLKFSKINHSLLPKFNSDTHSKNAQVGIETPGTCGDHVGLKFSS